MLTPPEHKLTGNLSYFQTGEIRGINLVKGEKTIHLPHQLSEMPDVVDRESFCFVSSWNRDVC